MSSAIRDRGGGCRFAELGWSFEVLRSSRKDGGSRNPKSGCYKDGARWRCCRWFPSLSKRKVVVTDGGGGRRRKTMQETRAKRTKKLPTWNKSIFTNYSPLGTQLQLGLDPPPPLSSQLRVRIGEGNSC
ncbi:hypothetical protein LXL04_027951 [Taraxacum kok-saghyz]